jgi:outer membrane lipase/esterase
VDLAGYDPFARVPFAVVTKGIPMRRTSVRTAIATAAAVLAALAGAAPPVAEPEDQGSATVHSVTVFGDSFSDVGSYQVATGDPANPGRFTVNPAGIWVDDVTAHYGLTVTPNRSLTLDKDASSGATDNVGTATALGGNGYAEGGARVATRPSESGVGNNQLVAPLTDQVDRYLATNQSFPADQLVLMSAGTNDTYAQFSALCWHTDDNNVGPRNITLASATQFNKILTTGIAGLPGVYYLDAGNVLAQVALHPSQYGMTNVTDPACTNTTPTSAAVFCTGATLVEPDAANTYLWADTFHPTPRGHQILADEALKLLVPHTG